MYKKQHQKSKKHKQLKQQTEISSFSMMLIDDVINESGEFTDQRFLLRKQHLKLLKNKILLFLVSKHLNFLNFLNIQTLVKENENKPDKSLYRVGLY